MNFYLGEKLTGGGVCMHADISVENDVTLCGQFGGGGRD